MKDGTAGAFGLFGRDEDLRVISTVLESGGSAVALGDAGVGKSSLLKVAGQLAQRLGRRVLSVSPTPFEHGLPFAGLAELIGQVPDEMDCELPEPQRRALAVALQRAEPEGPEADPLAVPLAVRGLLRQLCAREPVTVVIDDLQWMDHPSEGSLGFALRRLPVEPERLSVLVGARPEAGARDLMRSLPEPRRDLALAPLDEWAIGQLLRKRFGPRWTPLLSAGVALASGGNPFLALMIAEAMEAGALAWGVAVPGSVPVLPVPPSLADLLRERSEQMPDQAREVLLLVAAAGRISVAQLHRMVEAHLVRQALEAAADAEVAVVGAETLVSFTHPLLASAIYDHATPAQRRRAHRVLADKLEDPVERARHRSRAVTAPDEAVAGELEHAAHISKLRGAESLAGELLEAAALATPVASDAGAAFTRWLQAADAYTNAGDRSAAQAVLDHQTTRARTPDEQVQVLLRQYRVRGLRGPLRPLAEQALRLGPTDCATRAEILMDLGEAHQMEGNGRLGHRLTRLAVKAASDADRFDLRLAALQQQLQFERLFGIDDATHTWRELKRLADDPALNEPSAAFAWVRPWAYGFFADWDDQTAEQHLRTGIDTLVRAGRHGYLSYLYLALVLVLLRASRIDDAHTALDEADRSGAWSPSIRAQEDMARVFVTAYRGDLDPARELAQAVIARQHVRRYAYWQAGFLAQLGFIEVSARDWTAALSPLRRLAELVTRFEMVDPERLLWGVDYADAALQIGSLDEVADAVEHLRRQGAAGRPEARVAAQRCQALLTAAQGDVDRALHDLVAIVDRHAAECPFEHARSRLALGQVYRRAGYKALAAQTLNDAAAAFESLGIPRWAERARDEADRVGLNPGTATLTASEQRVADLVAAGRSNHETAAALFMAPKTVEANLTRIYRKLGIRSRTELANHMNAK